MARMRVLLRALAASAAFALVLASTLAVAAETDSDGDGVPDSIESATQRSVAASASGDELNISSRLVSASLEDQFDVSYKSGEFRVRYDLTGGGSSEFDLEFRNIVEWFDTNGNGQIDDGDQIAVTTPLGSTAFGDIPVNRSESSNADGGRVFTFLVRSKTNEITLRLTIAQRFMRLTNDRVLTPMEMKMDITINHVFVTEGASVGVEMRLDTGDDVEYGDSSWDDAHGFAMGDGAVSVSSGSADQAATTFFSWSKTALADGTRIPVTLTSTQREPDSYDLYLAYPLESPQTRVTILHDPTLGVESAVYNIIVGTPPPLQADLVLYAGSLAAIALLLGLTIVFANRRRKREE